MSAARGAVAWALGCLLVLLTLAPAGSATGPSSPADAAPFALEYETSAGRVELGHAFELTVLRRWPDDHEADPFEPSDLAPLRARLEGERVRRRDGVVEQRLSLRAWAFAPGALELAEPRFLARPRDGGPAHVVHAAPWSVDVQSGLAADDAGELEWPEPLPLPATPWPAWLLLLLVLVALGLYARGVGRERRSARERSSAVRSTPLDRARSRLRRLAEHEPDDAARARRDADELAALLRDYLADGLDVRAREMTTPELLDSPALQHVLGGSGCAALGRVLPTCDLAKFAARAPAPDERAGLLGAADDVLAAQALGDVATVAGPGAEAGAGEVRAS